MINQIEILKQQIDESSKIFIHQVSQVHLRISYDLSD